ncbi:MAG: endonuclease NucS, partial [Nitrososphaera sp.]|nr:endonuclease NucS [Nitrososphaera sp.]
MEVMLVKEAELELDEKRIQEAFEKDLGSLEEGLRYVASYVQIGPGIIDTLALDADSNPVIIEYKRQGAFDRDALIQLMDYYSWFASDPNHFLVLKHIIQKKIPDIDDVGQDIWLMAVVSDVEDRIKNACWSLKPPIRLVTYGIFSYTDGKIGLLPKVILDTAEESERLIVAPKSEDDFLREHEQFKPLY